MGVTTNAKIYFINIDNIIVNKLNDVYEINDIDELKDNIKKYGLKQPLAVVSFKDKYKLIAGHRRLTAIKQLFEENTKIMFSNRELMNQVPCIFENEYQDEDEEFLNLISSNSHRKIKATELKKVITRCAEIYDRKVENGEIIPNGTARRDGIAALACVSPRTVDKYLKNDFDPSENEDSKTKIKNVKSVLNGLDKSINYLKSIDIDEYGKTDKNLITSKVNELITIAKKLNNLFVRIYMAFCHFLLLMVQS